jgi:hypothetical protein
MLLLTDPSSYGQVMQTRSAKRYDGEAQTPKIQAALISRL